MSFYGFCITAALALGLVYVFFTVSSLNMLQSAAFDYASASRAITLSTYYGFLADNASIYQYVNQAASVSGIKIVRENGLFYIENGYSTSILKNG